MFLALNDDASAPSLNPSQLTADEFVTGLAPSHQAELAAPQPDAAKAASESAGTGASGLLAVFAEAKVTEKTNVLASLLGDTDASADMVLEALAARN